MSDRDAASLRFLFWLERLASRTEYILSQLCFSRFEMSDDETSSHSSQSSLSIDDENMPENVIRPYQFESEFSSSEEGIEGEEGELEEDHPHDGENARSRNLD